MNWNNKKIDAKIAQLEQQKRDIDEYVCALKNRKSDKLVECCSPWFNHNRPNNGCGKFFNISDLTYIQTHHYVKPFSCCGGDYYVESEGQFICPACGFLNRLIGDEGDALVINPRKYLMFLRQYFKEVVDTYDD